MGSQLNVFSPPYCYTIQVQTIGKGFPPKKLSKWNRCIFQIYKLRKEAGGKGRGYFRNIYRGWKGGGWGWGWWIGF